MLTHILHFFQGMPGSSRANQQGTPRTHIPGSNPAMMEVRRRANAAPAASPALPGGPKHHQQQLGKLQGPDTMPKGGVVRRPIANQTPQALNASVATAGDTAVIAAL